MAAPKYVYANATAGVADMSGWTVQLRLGEVWLSTDTMVIDNPHMFSDTPTFVQRSRPWEIDDEVEQATAAPGEKRRVARG